MTARSLSTQSEIARQGCAHGFFQRRTLAEKSGVRCRTMPCPRRKTAPDQRTGASLASLVATEVSHVTCGTGFGAGILERFGVYQDIGAAASGRLIRGRSQAFVGWTVGP